MDNPPQAQDTLTEPADIAPTGLEPNDLPATPEPPAEKKEEVGPPEKKKNWLKQEWDKPIIDRKIYKPSTVVYDPKKMEDDLLYKQAHQVYFDIGIRIYTIHCGVIFIGSIICLTALIDFGIAIWGQKNVEQKCKWYKFAGGGFAVLQGLILIIGGIKRSRKMMWFAVLVSFLAIGFQIFLLTMNLVNRKLKATDIVLLIVNVVMSVANFFMALSYQNYIRHSKARREQGYRAEGQEEETKPLITGNNVV